MCLLDARSRVGRMRPAAHAIVARAPLRGGGHMRRRAPSTVRAQSTTQGEPAKKRAVVIGNSENGTPGCEGAQWSAWRIPGWDLR